MSTRREHEPAIPDRLPGEEDIARLYQQTADEQPPEALDALVLATARRAVQLRFRLVKGGRIIQMTRRWAIPLSLAATLVVTIGVVTSLKEDIGRPLMSVQSETAPAVSAPAKMQSAQSQDQETRRDAREKAKQPASATLAEDAFDLKDAAASPQPKMDAPSPPVFSASQAARPTVPAPASTPMTSELREAKKEKQSAAKPLRQEKRRSNERNAALLEKAEEEADAALVVPAPSQEAMPQEEAESLFTDPLFRETGQQIGSADEKHGISTRSPKDRLADISQLFQAGKRREAEDSLRAFQKEHPNYTDYPDSFPADVLERLQKRALSEKPARRE